MPGKMFAAVPRNAFVRTSLLVALGVFASSVALLTLSTGSAAQPKAGVQSAPVLEVVVAVRSVTTGRIEFGIRDSEGALTSPRGRYLDLSQVAARDDLWLNSTPVTVHGVELRVSARSRQSGRIEFAIRDDSGGLVYPRGRYMRQDQIAAHDNLWLQSTSVEIAVSAEAAKTILRRALYRDDFGRASGNDWGCPFTGPAHGGTYECRAASLYGDLNTDPAPPSWTAYEGGHSGIDFAHGRNRNAPFYSLTSGKIVHAGRGWRCRDIAVYDGANTVVYLHASRIDVQEGDQVVAGRTRLGLQGEECSEVEGTANQHVHIEVIPGEVQVRYGATGRVYARGAGLKAGSLKPCDEISVDPLPYLYWWLIDGRGAPPEVETAACQASSATSTDDQSTPALDPVEPESESESEPSSSSGGQTPGETTSTTGDGNGGTTPPSAEELVRVAGMEDVYHVQGGYRRLIIAGGIIDAVPQFRWDAIRDVSQAVMNGYEVSRLVRLPDDDGRVYLVVTTGDDSAELRHIPDEAAFDRAGCDWDAVYDITQQEASLDEVYTKGAPMPASDWSCR